MQLRRQFAANLSLLRRTQDANFQADIKRNLVAILNSACRLRFSGRYPAYPISTFIRRAMFAVMKLHGMTPAGGPFTR